MEVLLAFQHRLAENLCAKQAVRVAEAWDRQSF